MMNKDAMGNFIVTIRKEKGLTQKDLAEKLHVTDKAVSKWERGISFPDISLLEPLSEIMEVTILELLEGKRLVENDQISRDVVADIVNQSISISDDEIKRKSLKSKKTIIFVSVLLLLLISITLNIYNYNKSNEVNSISIDSQAYETIVLDDGEVRFIDEQEALKQLLEDILQIRSNQKGDK